jgi:heme/copper-type cytochrome/quinol oxidase subunit 2
VCDGRPNCAEQDDSDEENCTLPPPRTERARSGYALQIVAAGCLIVVLLLIVIMTVVCCARTRNNQQLERMKRTRSVQLATGVCARVHMQPTRS